jgi:hypothetical protein
VSDSLKDILRKTGPDQHQNQTKDKWEKKQDIADSYATDDPDQTPTEQRHDHYRRKQEFASRLGPASERLPIRTKEQISFEGPIEKLIEKYKDPKEVFVHLSIGQLMKYELNEETGCIYEGERMIFDGEKLVTG